MSGARPGCPNRGQPPDRILLELHASDSLVCFLVFEDGKRLLAFVEKLTFELQHLKRTLSPLTFLYCSFGNVAPNL